MGEKMFVENHRQLPLAEEQIVMLETRDKIYKAVGVSVRAKRKGWDFILWEVSDIENLWPGDHNSALVLYGMN